MQRYDIVFKGRVQGVCFRATTLRVAGTFRVAGWVRNEADGSVRCVVEGEPDELDRFIDAVRLAIGAAGPARLDSVEIRTEAPSGEFQGFEIRTA